MRFVDEIISAFSLLHITIPHEDHCSLYNPTLGGSKMDFLRAKQTGIQNDLTRTLSNPGMFLPEVVRA